MNARITVYQLDLMSFHLWIQDVLIIQVFSIKKYIYELVETYRLSYLYNGSEYGQYLYSGLLYIIEHIFNDLAQNSLTKNISLLTKILGIE